MVAESTPVPLRELAMAAGGRVVGDESIAVTDVHHDSRMVGPGDLFVAVRGFTSDGHEFVATAAEQGAAAVCVESEMATTVPQLVVESARSALPALAAAVHHHPSRHLAVVGITGTNGKTTVTHLVEAIVLAAGRAPGLIGTLGTRSGARSVESVRTTPESSDLQRLLAAMRDDGVDVVALEVSSHALTLGRVDEVRFAVGAFTNLGHDHLDFHHDLNSYFEAKASLFTAERCERAVVCVSDEAGRVLAERIGASGLPLVTVGEGADVGAEEVAGTLDGTTFILTTPAGRRRIDFPLPGTFNVDNALVAAACAMELGIDLDAVAAGLAAAPAISGRFQSVDAGQDFAVVVDYAHTPDAVERAINEARELGGKRVVAVVGAAGDRDRAKRPLMGHAASLADIAIITSDNPRSEDPAEIVAAVTAGAAGGAAVTELVSRREAIDYAVAAAETGDVVLILGKGHERRQELAGEIIDFDDVAVARQALMRRSAS